MQQRQHLMLQLAEILKFTSRIRVLPTGTFKFPPTAASNIVLFAYIIAEISLYPKSLGSAQMVQFWRRTSSQSATRHFSANA